MRSTKSPSWIRRSLGLAAAPAPPHAFALSEDWVRYGAFPRAASGLEFREFRQVPLADTTFGTGVLGPSLMEEASLRAGIEDLLGRLQEPPQDASLVVPDSWLRIAFAEVTDLPRSARQRDDVVRWKLKRLVPFKVEELRLQATEVEPLPHQSEPGRVMLAFAAETLLGHLETSFSAYGIRIGLITNVSMALLEAAREAGGVDGMQAIVSVDDDSYTILYASDGLPVLYRHKPLGGGTGEQMIRRELRLTRTFVERQIGPPASARVFLFAGDTEEERWSEWLNEELGCREVRSGSEFVRGDGRPKDLDAAQVAPLMGAACTMIG